MAITPIKKTGLLARAGSTAATTSRVQTQSEESTGGALSLAALFDESTPATIGGANVPPGKYEAVLVYAKIEPANDKGQAALFKYEIADDGDAQGSVLHAYYNLTDPSGAAGKGLGFLKKDLAVLGYANIKGSEIEEALGQLEDEQLGVQITVKINGQYTNVYLNQLSEGSDVIDSWKATRPEKTY